jgi:hypothetical protein
VESVAGESGFSCAFNYFFSKDANEVIGAVGKAFKTVEDQVIANQSDCRKYLARIAKKPANDEELKKPELLSTPQWDLVKTALTVCERPDLIVDYHRLMNLKDAVFTTFERKTPEPTQAPEPVKTPRQASEPVKTPRQAPEPVKTPRKASEPVKTPKKEKSEN